RWSHFFIVQAEDGIRDWSVTGVQTCALPILIAVLQGRGQAAGTAVVAAQAGVPQLAASSLKAALDLDWDDPAARDAALAQVLGLLDQGAAFVAGQARGEAGPPGLGGRPRGRG